MGRENNDKKRGEQMKPTLREWLIMISVALIFGSGIGLLLAQEPTQRTVVPSITYEQRLIDYTIQELAKSGAFK